jgi:hypothetical protein
VLVHSIVVGREGTPGEYKLRGRAVAVDDSGVQGHYAAAVKDEVGWNRCLVDFTFSGSTSRR